MLNTLNRKGFMMHRMLAYLRRGVLATVCSGVLLLMAACGSSTASTPGEGSTTSTAPTATATNAPPTATPTPSCATALPGAGTPTLPSSFSTMPMPGGSVATAPTTSGGSTGQYTVYTLDVCYQGTLDEVNGPFSGHSSVLAQLLGMGWGIGPGAFPDDLQKLTACATGRLCLTDNGLNPAPPHLASFENLHDTGGGFITYHLKLAQVTPTPACDPAHFTGSATYNYFFDGHDMGSGYGHFQLPPATRPSSDMGGGTAGSTYIGFCSAGTPATIIAFLQASMTAAGWSISNVSASGFTALYPVTGGHHETDIMVTAANYWLVRDFHAPVP